MFKSIPFIKKRKTPTKFNWIRPIGLIIEKSMFSHSHFWNLILPYVACFGHFCPKGFVFSRRNFFALNRHASELAVPKVSVLPLYTDFLYSHHLLYIEYPYYMKKSSRGYGVGVGIFGLCYWVMLLGYDNRLCYWVVICL